MLKTQTSYDIKNGNRHLSSLINYGPYDKLGNLRSYTLTIEPKRSKEVKTIITHTFTYEKRSSYVQLKDEATTQGTSTPGVSRRYYDKNDNLERVVDSNGSHTALFLNDSQLGIRAKIDGTSQTTYLNVGGHNIADVKLDEVHNEQTLNIYTGFTPQGSPSSTIKQPMWQRRNALSGMNNQDYIDDKAYRATVEESAKGQAANTAQDNYGAYTVQSGDSLQSIAQMVYGDASLWYLIADANGITGNGE